MQIQLLSERFKQCFYTKIGTGYPIVLVHGFGEDSRVWEVQVNALSKEYTVFIPDLPGSGASQLPSESMSMELLADFLVELLNQEGIEKTILFGHSMGGYATLAFAELFPHRLEGFALVHSSAYADDEAKKENRRKSIRLIEHDGKDVFLKAMIPNLFSESFRQARPQDLEKQLTQALELSSLSIISYLKAMINRNDRTFVLQQSSLPILFIMGTEDNVIPYQQGLEQSSMPSIGMIEVLQNTGHMGMIEQAEKLNSIANKFCKTILERKKH